MSNTITAELSSISTQAQELLDRITALGDQYRHTPDSLFVAECNTAEKSLTHSIRAIERAQKLI
ncbi:MAG: hypothetical protein KBF89_01000 [Acidimicrobiia bacterium]|nr:hypothetical protein [Acidimicrobiia bacterium]